ncbi:MAG: hypothetical protein WAZ94_08420 [Phycisphaerales bacterium]
MAQAGLIAVEPGLVKRHDAADAHDAWLHREGIHAHFERSSAPAAGFG